MNECHRNKDIDIIVLPKIFENSLICNCGRRDISAVQCVVGLKSEKLVKYGFSCRLYQLRNWHVFHWSYLQLKLYMGKLSLLCSWALIDDVQCFSFRHFKHWESAFVCIILAHSGEESISRRPNKIFERNYPTILPDYQSKLILSLCFLSFSSFIQRFCLVIIWIAYLSQYCSSILWHIYLCPGGTVHERNPVRA